MSEPSKTCAHTTRERGCPSGSEPRRSGFATRSSDSSYIDSDRAVLHQSLHVFYPVHRLQIEKFHVYLPRGWWNRRARDSPQNSSPRHRWPAGLLVHSTSCQIASACLAVRRVLQLRLLRLPRASAREFVVVPEAHRQVP